MSHLFRNIEGVEIIDRSGLYEPVVQQSTTVTGVYLILEGECTMNCDLELLRETDQTLTIDNREPTLNLGSLKQSLDKSIIPHKFDHDFEQKFSRIRLTHKKEKIIRILEHGDMVGDIEAVLQLPRYLFTIKNVKDKPLQVLYIPLHGLSKFIRQNGITNSSFTNIIELKCETYIKQKVLTVLFYNLLTLTQTIKYPRKTKKHELTDFRATLELYGKSHSQLVPSHVNGSMQLMLKMKRKQNMLALKRQREMNDDHDNKLNYYRNFHQSSARSRKQLEELRVTDTKEDGNTVPRNRKISSSANSRSNIPMNHPAVSNMWLVMKAVTKFKHFSETLQLRRLARSKEQLQKNVRSYSNLEESKKKEDKQSDKDELEFDPETGDKHLSLVENNMQKFMRSLDQFLENDNKEKNRDLRPSTVTPMSRFTIKSQAIPQLGGTVLVRYRPCTALDFNETDEENDEFNQGHVHMRHHILPRDTLSALQKYRANKLSNRSE